MVDCYVCGDSFNPRSDGRICNRCSAIKSRDYRATLHGQFMTARGIARRRGIEFALTEEEYTSLRLLPCHYCGFPAPSAGMGIDRKDETLAYRAANVVSCCTECNLAKNASFTYEEMLLLGAVIAQIKTARRECGETHANRLGRPQKHSPGIDRPDRVRRCRINPEIVQAVISARTEERLSLHQIAERHDLYVSTVSRILARHGIPVPTLANPRPSSQHGEKNPHAKLTADLVHQIRAAHTNDHLSQGVLAARFGISQTAIHKILSGKTWAHVV